MKNFKPILTAMSLCMALAAAAAPVRQHLHDDWQFRQARLNNWYPATVPGTVHTDLMANRIIEDPYFRLNERGVQWVDKEDWIYETHFEADAGLLARERIELVFEGLDTYADVYLNDEKVLAADNMFRRWRTEVKRLLRPGENTLKVYFHSPIKVDLPKYDSLPYRYEAVNDQSANGGLFDKRVSVFARKAGYHYGWDWGPRLVTSGIWRPVYLEGWSGARISDVFYRQQEVTARRARVEVEVEIASVRDLAEAVVTVASPGEGIEASVTAPAALRNQQGNRPARHCLSETLVDPRTGRTSSLRIQGFGRGGRRLRQPDHPHRAALAAPRARQGRRRHDLLLRTQRRAALRQRSQLHPLRRLPAARHARRLREDDRRRRGREHEHAARLGRRCL